MKGIPTRDAVQALEETAAAALADTTSTEEENVPAAPKKAKSSAAMLFPKELQSEVRELLDTDDKQAVNRDLCDHHRFGGPADTEQPAVPLLPRRQTGERHVSQTEAVL